MEIQLIIFIFCLVLLIAVVGYVIFNFVKKKKIIAVHTEKNSMYELSETESKIEEDHKLYLVQGDRTDVYKITVLLNGQTYEREFYAYLSSITRDQILNEFYYVNEREILLIDDEGEHYYNQNRIERIDFIHRKLFVEKTIIETLIEESVSVENETEIVAAVDEKPNLSVEEDLTEVGSLLHEPDGINAIKDNKRFFKQKKMKKQSLKPMKAKTFNRFFLGSLVLLVCISLLGFIRTLGLSSRVNNVQATVTSLPKEFGNSNQDNYSEVYRLNLYLTEFFETYIPLTNDLSEMEKRGNKLKGYFADNVSINTESKNINRKLISTELVDLDAANKIIVAKYRIGSITEKDGKEINDYFIYTVNLVENMGKYSLVSLPSITKEESLQTGFSGIEKKEEGSKLADSEFNSVNDFCKLFLEKYASGTEAELEYMMVNVESMGEAYELETIDSSEYYQSDDSIHGYLKATFKQADTNVLHQENFSFEISKVDEQYKIIKMNHYLGGLN